MDAPAYVDLLGLSGKVAIVTGASGGIGASISRRLAEAGATVIIHYRHHAKEALALAEAIVGTGGKATVAHAQLDTEVHVVRMVQWAVQECGGVDILVNNAGTYPTEAFLSMRPAEWRATYEANLVPAVLCTSAVAAHMIDSGGGAIINLASVAALSPSPRQSHYSSAKAAVVMFTRAMAQELGAHRIRVNAISPGLIERPGIEQQWADGVARWRAMAPLSRLGSPDDVADACLFLASPAARWVTGHNLVVDGGMTATALY
jgi:NAD(P)-dependent dehydrogenase (short-subunit alcohol dehydrogenase family)